MADINNASKNLPVPELAQVVNAAYANRSGEDQLCDDKINLAQKRLEATPLPKGPGAGSRGRSISPIAPQRLAESYQSVEYLRERYFDPQTTASGQAPA